MQIVRKLDVLPAARKAVREALKYPMDGGMDLAIYRIKLGANAYYIGTQLVLGGLNVGDPIESTRFTRKGKILYIRRGSSR